MKKDNMKLNNSLMIFIRTCCLVCAFSCGIFFGCSGSQDGTVTNVRVRASSGGVPVTETSLSILSDGKAVTQKRPAADEHGLFLIQAKGLPAGCTVALSDARMGETTLDGDLLARIDGLNLETDIAYVNAVTTLVAAYMAKHPEKKLVDAEAVIRKFLEIDETVALGQGLSVQQQYFSHSEFMKGVANKGGFRKFIDSLVVEIDGSPSATHPFRGDVMHGMAGAACEFALTGLANGALSYVGGKSFGWALSKTGLGGIFGGDPPPIDPQVLVEMQQSISTINNNLVALQATVDRQYKDLKQQVNMSEYDMRMDLVSSFVSTVVKTQARMDYLVNLKPTTENKQFIQDEKTNIRRIISDQIENHLNDIHNVLVGADNRTPLFKLFSKCVAGEKRFFDATQSQITMDKWDYFDIVQTAMVQMMVEYYHSYNITDKAQAVVDAYRLDQRSKQQGLRPRQLPAGYIIDTKETQCTGEYRTIGICLMPPRMWKTTPFTGNRYYLQNEACGRLDQVERGWPIGGSCGNTYCGYWSAPTGPEMLDLTAGWTGTSPAKWLADQGVLDSGFINSPLLYHAAAAACCIYDTFGFVSFKDGVFNMQTGKIEDYGCWGCYERYPAKMNGFIVRDLAAGEFYYYK